LKPRVRNPLRDPVAIALCQQERTHRMLSLVPGYQPLVLDGRSHDRMQNAHDEGCMSAQAATGPQGCLAACEGL